MSQVANGNTSRRVRHLSLTPSDVASSPGEVSSFGGMQVQMESELERRRREWEDEVMRMQEDFFKVKVNNNNNSNGTRATNGGLFDSNHTNNNNMKRNVDVELTSADRTGNHLVSRTQQVREIAAPRAEVEEGSDGGRVWRLQFEMQSFDPRAINVKVDGNKLLVTSRVQQETTPGNTSTKQFTRQVSVTVTCTYIIFHHNQHLNVEF